MKKLLDERFMSLKRQYCKLYSEIIIDCSDTVDFGFYNKELKEANSSRDFLEYFDLSDIERWIKEIKGYIQDESTDESDCLEYNPTGYPYNQL